MSQLITNGETESEFYGKIREAINFCSIDNELNIPDFILAEYVLKNLLALKQTLQASASWKGEPFEFRPGNK
jgi:hypothetical protein